MATRKLLLWFEKRRKSKTLDLAQQQITLALSTVEDLNTAMRAWSEDRTSDVENIIQHLLTKEEEIDRLRRAIFEELTRSRLPIVYREDLKRLVSYIDRFADQIKDSARCLKILGGSKLPCEIIDQCLMTSQSLVDCVRVLGSCIETLGLSPTDVRGMAERVCFFEGSTDDEYLNAKKLLISHGKDLEPTILVIFWDLLGFMEQAAHTCARTADHLRVLAASEMPST